MRLLMDTCRLVRFLHGPLCFDEYSFQIALIDVCGGGDSFGWISLKALLHGLANCRIEIRVIRKDSCFKPSFKSIDVSHGRASRFEVGCDALVVGGLLYFGNNTLLQSPAIFSNRLIRFTLIDPKQLRKHLRDFSGDSVPLYTSASAAYNKYECSLATASRNCVL